MIATVTLNPSLDRTLHFPGVRIGELNRATRARLDLSGKGVNVSMALRRFGLETLVAGFVAGRSGEVLASGLAAEGYACEFVWVEGETRSNVTVIDDATGVTTKLNEPGPCVTAADLDALEERLLARLGAGDICILSGSLPQGAPPETYRRLVTSLGARGATVVLDSSGEPLRLGCAARPALVKPNAVEAGEILGLPVREGDGVPDVPDTLQRILAEGPASVLLSLDRRGAAYCDGQETWQGEPPPITEISAVGAGDALLSGALWARLQGLGPGEMLRWGIAAGTAAAMGQGSAMPEFALVQEVYARVQVRRVA